MRLLIAGGVILLITLLVRWLLLRFIPPRLEQHSPLWAEILENRNVLRYIYLAVPGLLVAGFAGFLSFDYPTLTNVISKIATIYSIVMLTMAIVAALYAYGDYYDQHYTFAKQVPIKTVIQSVVALVVVFGVTLMVAILLNVPLLAMASIFVGIGAIAYYLFREPLLGFTASLQLSMNRMLGIGDWMEMPSHGVDGRVEDINVTSTKVRNWDNSIVNVPTSHLVRNPFVNWHVMQSRHARRILRPIYIDQTSIAFADEAQRAQNLAEISELYEGLSATAKKSEGLLGVTPDALTERETVTNLELFMAYATLVIAGHEKTRTDYDIYVRAQDPSPQGIPVEAFFFTRDTDFIPYYAVQREIISHLLATLPQFGLRPYQLFEK